MEKGTLTVRMESISQDFAQVFGVELCRDRVTDAIQAYERSIVTLNHFASLKSNSGKSLEEILESNANARGAMTRLEKSRSFLDSCLDFLGGSPSVTSPNPSAEDYRVAFAPFLESKTHDGAVIYGSEAVRSGAVFDKLMKIYKGFPSPVSYMTDMTEKLGNPNFANDSLRLRILKQMLLCIDFTDTDINLGELSAYNRNDVKKVSSLTEDVFDSTLESTISPASDIKALLKNYGDIVSGLNETGEALLGLVYPEIAEKCPDNTRVIGYLRDCLSGGTRLKDIFPDENILTARRIIKDGIRFFKEECTASLYEIKSRAKKCLKVAEGKKSAEKLAEYALKCIENGALNHTAYSEKYASELKSSLETHEKLTQKLKALAKALRETEKTGEKDENGKFTETEQSLKIRALSDSLAEAKLGIEAELSECIGIFRENLSIIEELEGLKSLIGKRNVLYHNDGGTWDEDKEQRLPPILRICNYLASGGDTDTDPYFARSALYLFAFAFGMKYYTSENATDYDRNRDIAKKLFTEFYSDNIVHFLGSDGTKFYREPSGVGINTKNYRECVYLYFLNNPPKNQRTAYAEAYNLLKHIGLLEGISEDSTAQSGTRIYKSTILPELLGLKDRGELFGYITKNFVISRKSTAGSTFRIREEAGSAYSVYDEIRTRLDLDTRLSDSESRSSREYKEDVFECFEEYAREVLGIRSLTPSSRDSDFHRALKLVFLRINPKNSEDICAESITRTMLLAEYFYYYCFSREGCVSPVGVEFSEVYREFSAIADAYLDKAGLQRISVKNLFDTVLILLAYIYVNSSVRDTRAEITRERL